MNLCRVVLPLTLACWLPQAACSACDPYVTIQTLQTVSLLDVISSSGLPAGIGVPAVVLTLPPLDGESHLETLPAGAQETIQITLGDAQQTGATCDASAIAAALVQTGADLRDSVNLITPMQKFSIVCQGAGAWATAQITLVAAGVVVPVPNASTFTLSLELSVDAGGAATTLFGTQSFGFTDVTTLVPGHC